MTNNPESQQAERLLERLRGPERTNEIVIVRSADRTVDAPGFQSFVQQLYADVSSLGPGVVAGGTNYYQSKDEALLSRDRRTTILPFVMAGVFGGIAAGDLVMFQQMGFGLGVAILLDATVVRSVLAPAAMQLLGDKNWYLPRILRWLPEIRTEKL